MAAKGFPKGRQLFFNKNYRFLNNFYGSRPQSTYIRTPTHQ